MKKTLLLLLLVVACIDAAVAQTVVTGRQRNHYYSSWYDTCYHYYSCWLPSPPYARSSYSSLEMENVPHSGSSGPTRKVAITDYTDKPLTIKGIAVMLSNKGPLIPGHPDCVIDSFDQEYVSIGYYDRANNRMNILDSARWDTLTPKTWNLQLVEDPAEYPNQSTFPVGIASCYLYEAYFDKPVTVDSLFCLIGTTNGNRDSLTSGLYSHLSARRLVKYQYITTGSITPDLYHLNTCFPRYDWKYYYYYSGEWTELSCAFGYGPFIPIIDGENRTVTVHSSDTSMGYGVGGPYVMDSTWTEIHAHAHYGNRFTHWNDGDTTNPRQVFVTSDTTFTAYFDSVPFHTITVSTNNFSWGYVRGGGSYPETEGAPIQAIPRSNGRFLRWSDGVYNMERVIYMTSDTNIQAIFEQKNDSEVESADPDKGVTFTLSPNPTEGSVLLTATDFESRHYDYRRAAVVVLDVAGHEVYRTPLTAPTVRIDGLSAGVYFVILVTPQASSTQRLVVK